MSKLSKMKKEDVEQQLASMDEAELDEKYDEGHEDEKEDKALIAKMMKKKMKKEEYEMMDEANYNSDNPEFEGRLAAIDMHHYKEADHHRKTLRTLGTQGKLNTPEGKFHKAALEKHQSALNAMAASDHKIMRKKLKMRSLKKEESVTKISRDDIDVSEDIAAAFSGSDLSEEFKAQATEIFETAVVSAVNMKLAEIAEQAEEEHAEEMQRIEEGLTTKIDEYLDYVVEQWMQENKLAVESGLRSEVTENFLSGLRNLFAENWIDIPEEKVEVVEELASEVEQLTATLDEQMQKNIELKKQVEKFEREIAFVDVSEGLTEMQIAKFESLAEAVDYEDAESYKQKLETIRTSFFESRSEEVTESRTTLDEEFIETNETSEKKLDPSMQVYSAAISRSVKK